MPPLRSRAEHSLASGANAAVRAASAIPGRLAVAAGSHPLRHRLVAKVSIKALLPMLTWRQAYLLWRSLSCSG
jgi:hypothetical protein